MTGRFITLEGIEGAGKSTVAAALESWLIKRGQRVLIISSHEHHRDGLLQPLQHPESSHIRKLDIEQDQVR